MTEKSDLPHHIVNSNKTIKVAENALMVSKITPVENWEKIKILKFLFNTYLKFIQEFIFYFPSNYQTYIPAMKLV